jgi:hypothetical protein
MRLVGCATVTGGAAGAACGSVFWPQPPSSSAARPKQRPAVAPGAQKNVRNLFKANLPETTGLNHHLYRRAIKGKDAATAQAARSAAYDAIMTDRQYSHRSSIGARRADKTPSATVRGLRY